MGPGGRQAPGHLIIITPPFDHPAATHAAPCSAYLTSEAHSLVRGLLTKDAKKRLGYGPTGSANVRAHPFFKGVDWGRLAARAVPSPFRPAIKSAECVENFDKIWTDLPATVRAAARVEGRGGAEGCLGSVGLDCVGCWSVLPRARVHVCLHPRSRVQQEAWAPSA